MKIALKTAHGTYLRAGDLGEINTSKTLGPWELFDVIEQSSAPNTVTQQWKGNFLYPKEWFFGPACASLSDEQLHRYFSYLQTNQHHHVVINAEQADWGPSKGHPEWTHGGFTAYQNGGIDRLIHVCQFAQAYRLTCVMGVVDQPTLPALTLDAIIGRSRQLVDATSPYVSLYMLSWEINEVWSSGDVREYNLERWINEVNWKDRDVGIHFSGGNLSGGFNFYGRMPSNVVRLYQWEDGSFDDRLRHEAMLIAEVAIGTHTKVCAFEHSSPLNQSTSPSLDECSRKARLILKQFEDTVYNGQTLQRLQYGSLNGF